MKNKWLPRQRTSWEVENVEEKSAGFLFNWASCIRPFSSAGVRHV